MWTKELQGELCKIERIPCRTQRNNDPEGLGGLHHPKSTSDHSATGSTPDEGP